jgi:protein phosphatase
MEDDGPNFRAQLDELLKLYTKIINSATAEEYARKRPKLRLPIVAQPLLVFLISECQEILKSEPNVLHIDIPVIVVGDLHGDILDLIRFLREFGLPPRTRYLFLGDFIDRGDFSTETITLLLLLKFHFRANINLIRGNHEFEEACIGHTDFYTELRGLYGSGAPIDPFMSLFSYLPLAADIAEYAFGVHGGLSPTFLFVSQLEEIPRPITSFSPKLIEDVLWSDPLEQVPDVAPSPRGLGIYFGVNVVKKFLDKNGFSLIVRGHQSVESGVSTCLNFMVVTVCSASSYCGDINTQAGVLLFAEGPSYEKRVFEALPILKRSEVPLLTPQEFAAREEVAKGGTSARGVPPFGIPRLGLPAPSPVSTAARSAGRPFTARVASKPLVPQRAPSRRLH